MAKVLKVIGIIAGVVAFAATALGFAFPALAATTAKVAAIAGIVSTVANLGAALLARPPNARGSVNSLTIGANQPMPCILGRTYSGGTLVHDTGYGGTVDGVPNPYRFLAVVYSLGLCAALEAATTDFTAQTFSGNAATGYYSGFLYRDYQLGAMPEADALTPQWAGATNWGTGYKLSGLAAIGWSLKFDKKGKIFASGVPQLGAIWRGVPVYDPRLDSSYPGGSGPQRIDNEASWGYSDNPALHALAYAYGRHQNGKRVFGVDLGGAAISVEDAVAWANVCEANGWTIGGTIFEPGDSAKWNNLKAICQAGSAEPYFAGGVLRFRWDAPRVATETITIDDLADGDIDFQAMTAWKDRLNTVIPRWRSEEQQWTYVPGDAQSDSVALSADGEVKTREIQMDLVQNGTQAAQLARYIVANSRERGPLTLPLKPRLAAYGAGSTVKIGVDLARLIGLPADQMMLVRSRSIDPSTGIVTLTLQTETSGKHAFALAASNSVPTALTPLDPELRDQILKSLAEIGDDGILTPDEKSEILIPLSNELLALHDLLITRAADYLDFTAVSDAVATLNVAWLNWLAYRNGLSPAWNDISASTSIVRSVYDSYILALRNALEGLSDALRDTAAKTAQWPTITGTGKPADNATRNVVTYSSTAPASPIDGDLWVDLSGTYAVFKLRSGGAWVTGANALTAYNALSGKPIALADINTTESSKLAGIAPNATRNQDGANMLATPRDAATWTLTNSAALSTTALPGVTVAQLVGSANSTVRWGAAVPCTPGQSLWMAYLLKSDGGTGEPCNASITYTRADGSTFAVNYSSTTAKALNDVSSGWVTVKAPFVVPEEAIALQLYLERPTFSGYSFFAYDPYVGRAEPGATLGAPSGTPVGSSTADDVVNTGNTALATANAANLLAASASSAATAANNFATDVASDNKFTAAEKKRYVSLVNGWALTIPDLVAAGNALGLTAEASALNSAWSAFYSLLVSYGYASVNVTTSISASTFLAYEQAFQTALTTLQKAAANAGALGAQNTLFNGGFRLGLTGWSASSWSVIVDYTGASIQPPLGTGGLFVASSQRPVNVGPGAAVVLGATFSAAVSTSGKTFYADIEWRNGGNGAILGYSSTSTNTALWTNEGSFTRSRKFVKVNAPSPTDGSGFVTATVRLVSNIDIANVYGYFRFEQVKLEFATTPSGWSDEATDGANLTSSTGRLPSGAATLAASVIAGARAVPQTAAPLSQSNAGSSVTIYIASNTWLFDDGRSVTYPSGSFPGLAYSTSYVIWRNDPNVDGGSSYGISTDINAAIGTGKVGLWTFTTMDASGVGGGSGGLAGGGGGVPKCPADDMMILTEDGVVPVADLLDPDYRPRVWVVGDSWRTLRLVPLRAIDWSDQPCVTLDYANGASVTCSATTPVPDPMTPHSGKHVDAPAMLHRLGLTWAQPVSLDWVPVARVTDAGVRRVAHIDAGGNIILCGADAARLAAIHNKAVDTGGL